MSDSFRNRQAHLQWCKDRALEYVDRGDMTNAFASMLSDLGKHPHTADSVGIGTMLMLTVDRSNPDAVRSFINGFN